MATVNKNFRVKNGLVVEGNTATVNGYDILTKASADQSYIIDLIGGQATSTNTANAVVKRDGSGNFSAGTITANLTGNVTGTVSSISNHDTDDLTEGSTNLYFTDSRARAALSSGTGITYNSSTGEISVTANTYDAYGAASAAQTAAETYADGLAVNYDAAGSASTAQSNAETYADNLVNGLDTDDIEEGTTNKYFTNQRALDATSAAYDAAGSASTAQSNAETFATNAINALDSDDIEEGASNLYFTNGRARNAVSAGTGITYSSADGVISVTSNTFDAYGAASTAESNSNTYTDNAINALDTDDIEEGSTNKYFSNTLARNAFSVTSGMGLTYDSANGLFGADTNYLATHTYVDSAISNLVDGAPALLNTLNEIAAAINDDANYFTTISNQISAKQNTLTAGANIDITNDVISVTGLDTDDVAEGSNLYFTDSRARDAVDGTDRSFTSVSINEVAKQFAATTGNIATAAATTVYSWAKADYRSAEVLVKVKNGSHTEVSKLLITLDTSDNVSVNEYGITGTNGSLATVTADVSGSDVRIRVTPANNNSEVIAVGTLLI